MKRIICSATYNDHAFDRKIDRKEVLKIHINIVRYIQCGACDNVVCTTPQIEKKKPDHWEDRRYYVEIHTAKTAQEGKWNRDEKMI